MNKFKLLLLGIVLALGASLRLVNLVSLPNGLHWDEMDTGYQAFSLLKTGKDYYGNVLPLFPHSVADYRTPVYIYSAIPSVAKLGMSAVSVRSPSVLWSMLGIVGVFLLATNIFKDSTTGLLAALTLALSPWHVQYSRQSVETISLTTLLILAVTLFLKGIRDSRYLILSGLFFGLSTAAYSPGKLFVPLFLVCLVFLNRREIFQVNKKTLLSATCLFMFIFAPIFVDGVIGKSGMRFRELSVFTDPTTAETVKWRREEQALSSGIPKTVGMSPRFIDKLVYNKITLWGKTIVDNYLSAFSTEYLFQKGDRELRHSPGKDSYGMLQVPEVIPLVLGAVAAPAMLVYWAVLAPVSASLTRWDNPHAARLLILLPVLVLLISSGLRILLKKSKLLFSGYLVLLSFSTIFTYAYFFNNYSWESAAPFQYGFQEAVLEAISQKPNYDRVILDYGKDSGLMSYLFATRQNPKALQALQPLSTVQIAGVNSHVLDNVYLLHAGSHPWNDLLTTPTFPTGKSLLVVRAAELQSQKLGKPYQTIFHPDGTPAFYFFAVSK